MFQDREIRSDDMTGIFPSSHPILKETFNFFIGIGIEFENFIVLKCYLVPGKCYQ